MMTSKEISNTSGIYKIVNLTNGKLYVGSALRMRDRGRDHFTSLRKGDHYNKFLQRAFNLSPEQFEVHVIEEVESILLLVREEFWIKILDSCNSEKGYNLCPHPTRTTQGLKLSEEQNRKKSEYMKTRPPISEEIRKRISEGLKGKKKSAECIAKMSVSKKGKAPTEETRKILSAAALKRPPRTKETHDKISAALKESFKNDPEMKKRHAERMKKIHSDPEFLKRRGEAISRGKQAKKNQQTTTADITV